MYGFNDMTYCVSKNCQNKCGRKLTDEIRKKAQKEWEKITKSKTDVPFAVARFCEGED